MEAWEQKLLAEKQARELAMRDAWQAMLDTCPDKERLFDGLDNAEQVYSLLALFVLRDPSLSRHALVKSASTFVRTRI